MKVTHLCIIAGAVLASGNAVFADTLVGSSVNTGFQSYGSVNENNKPFWDSPSLDGSHKNIGYYVNSTYSGSGGIHRKWFGYKQGVGHDGDADLSMYFAHPSGIDEGSLKLEIAGNANYNEVGWYDTASPAVHHAIWSGANTSSLGADQAFLPTGSWGLYITGPGGTYYMNSALNSNGDTQNQHFAIFALDLTAGAEKYLIGVEDLSSRTNHYEGDGDYNDFVFTLSTTSIPDVGNTPEPTSLSLLGLGAAGLLARRRKAKK